jgi:hypothetical protein
MVNLIFLLIIRALGAFVGIEIGRFLGSEGTAIMTTGPNLVLCATKKTDARLTRNEQENGCAPNAQRLSRAQPLLVR